LPQAPRKRATLVGACAARVRGARTGRRKPAVALGAGGNLRRGALVRPRAQVPQLVVKGAPHDRARALHQLAALVAPHAGLEVARLLVVAWASGAVSQA